MNKWRDVWISHVMFAKPDLARRRQGRTRHRHVTYKWGRSCVTSHVAYERVMSHMNESLHARNTWCRSTPSRQNTASSWLIKMSHGIVMSHENEWCDTRGTWHTNDTCHMSTPHSDMTPVYVIWLIWLICMWHDSLGWGSHTNESRLMSR